MQLPPDTLLHQVLRARRESDPDKVGIIYEDTHYSYREIDDRSEKIGAALQADGLRRGERVVVCLGNRIETVFSFWGALKAGGVISNVGLEVSASNLEYIIRNAEASVLITTADKLASLPASTVTLPYIRSIILVDGLADSPGVSTFEQALNRGMERVDNAGTIDADLASIIYTSGSTGSPKGVMLTHRNMRAALASLHAYLGYDKSDKVLCSLPLSFDYGLYQMIMCLSAGATLILEKEFTWPIFLIKKIKQYQVSIIPFVPTMLMLLHEYADKRRMTFSSVRMVTNTGAALKQAHIARMKALFPAARIFSMYGLTECKRCTYLPPEDIDRKPGSVGIAIPNTELWLIDDDGKKIDKPYQTGQLVIRGSTVMAGYWKNPEATAKKLRPGLHPGEVVLHTGDYCSLDEEGYLYFEGRMDHVIKSRGMKVSPNEVERFLDTIDGIESAAVVGVEDDDAGEGLCTFVTIAPGSSLREADILAKCRSGLESHKVPHLVVVVESLPRTANGKFDVMKLQEAAQRTLQERRGAKVVT